MFLCSFFVLRPTLVSQLWDRNFVQSISNTTVNFRKANVAGAGVLPWECGFSQFFHFFMVCF